MSTRKLSILAAVAADSRTRKQIAFSPDMMADILEVFAEERAGRLRCGCAKLARVLKARYDLPWAVTSIRDRLLQIKDTDGQEK